LSFTCKVALNYPTKLSFSILFIVIKWYLVHKYMGKLKIIWLLRKWHYEPWQILIELSGLRGREPNYGVS
jgi:hypothetical protein